MLCFFFALFRRDYRQVTKMPDESNFLSDFSLAGKATHLPLRESEGVATPPPPSILNEIVSPVSMVFDDDVSPKFAALAVKATHFPSLQHDFKKGIFCF